MLLSDALTELATGLDVVYHTTQGALLTCLTKQLTRLAQCEESLRFAVLKNGHVHLDQRRDRETLTHELESQQSRNKKLQARITRDKQDHTEEKEWIASLWPDAVVMPTILKAYAPHDERMVSQVEATEERHKLQALVNRRAEKERVLLQIETSLQWKMAFVAPSLSLEGEYIAGQAFYQNVTTGETLWEPPVAMFYEPPVHWDRNKMDWKDSYPLENLYPLQPQEQDVDSSSGGDNEENKKRQQAEPTDEGKAVSHGPSTPALAASNTQPSAACVVVKDSDSAEDSDGDSSSGDEEQPGQRPTGPTERSHDKNASEEDEDDGEAETPDPAVLRVELEKVLDQSQQLQAQLDKSLSQQRGLALQLLNASRDAFEREKETLAQEDEHAKTSERQKRKAKQQEDAAAKASAEAQQARTQRESDTNVQRKFAKASVGKKELTLSKDDELFEKELDAFVAAQRSDKLYLAAPLAKDPRVKKRHQLEEEFLHMKKIEARTLAMEQSEYDLIEKTSSRQEEAETKCQQLVKLMEEALEMQQQVSSELEKLPTQIKALEVASPPPVEIRPSQEQLQRAKERFVSAEPAAAGGGGEEKEATSGRKQPKAAGAGDEEEEEEDEEEEGEEEKEDEAAALPMTPEDRIAMERDEAELTQLKLVVEAEQKWYTWETDEVMRLEDLAAAYDRFETLQAMARRLQVDVALFQSDLQFWQHLVEKEKDTNAKLWKVQADGQVERARFLLERVAREESVFQVEDEYEAVVTLLQEAQRLPRQARNPLEKLHLLEQSQKQAEKLQKRFEMLQKRCLEEQNAQKLLMEMENKFCVYSERKLHEETTLFHEKQTLWELNVTIQDELLSRRDTIEKLYQLLHGSAEATTEKETEAATHVQYEDATRGFQDKLDKLETVRQFLLLCYTRESRWRALASVALVKDTSSDVWMTEMQRDRHEQMMVSLQNHHDGELKKLHQEIKLLTKVKELLQAQVMERENKLNAVQRDYQKVLEDVRLETQQIIFGLKLQFQEEEKAHRDDQRRAIQDRNRMMQDHDILVSELHLQVATLEQEKEQQAHWLTSAKRELHAQRVANEELLMGYSSLEKRRATETNDMKFRISAQIVKINAIEMWNLALKIQAKEAHHDKLQLQKQMAALAMHHKQQQRLLRLENWKHRVTAQAILTNVDLLFSFFAQGLEILASTTTQANTLLRCNGGIEVLVALAQHSSQDPIRIIAAKALGLVTWDANATPRALGWKAKKLWFQWQTKQSGNVLDELKIQRLEFDSVAKEDSEAMNWLADTSGSGGIGESDCDLFDTKTKNMKKIHFLKNWNAQDEKEFPVVNNGNQEYVGLAPRVLTTIIDLCKSPAPSSKLLQSTNDSTTSTALQIQRNALRSLALVVMNTRNTAIVGRLDGCIPLLVGLLQGGCPDPQVVRNAIQALANLAFQNEFNQSQIHHAGAVPLLVANCRHHQDADVLLASVQALAHLSFENLFCCQGIFDAKGIPILTRLCHSYRIHDAIDLDLFEEIQACAAEVISNVVTILDSSNSNSSGQGGESDEQPQQGSDSSCSGFKQRDLVEAILAAKEEEPSDYDQEEDGQRQKQLGSGRVPPGVATFVLMCASCTRDVAFHGALVLGSIAQHDEIRAAIGNAGGIDALFLLASKKEDAALVAQATWALANATWNRENQYRLARYLDALYDLCTFSQDGVGLTNNQQEDSEEAAYINSNAALIREHALCVLANTLFYNDANRHLVACQVKWMTLLEYNCRHLQSSTGGGSSAMLEHSARALCSLSYSDAIALAMGGGSKDLATSICTTNDSLAPARAVNALDIFIRLCSHSANPLVQQHALFGVINMCLHDANKAKILEIPHGVETLVNLSGSTNHELCDPAIEALDLLADVRTTKHALVGSSPVAVLSPSTMSSLAASDLKKLISMLQEVTGNPALVAMASDAIADEVWKKPSAKVRLRNEHGLDTLLELCVGHKSAIAGHDKVLLSCLWALRNSISDNVRNQDYVGALRGVPQLVGLYDRHRDSDDVVEAVLAVVVALVMKHPRNSQELVECGLDMLLALVEGRDGAAASQQVDDGRGGDRDPEEARRDHQQPSSSLNKNWTQPKIPSKENSALARELLLLVAAYNTAQKKDMALPSLAAKSTSPEKQRALLPTKKPHHSTAVHLPPVLASSPLAAAATHGSPTKRDRNN